MHFDALHARVSVLERQRSCARLPMRMVRSGATRAKLVVAVALARAICLAVGLLANSIMSVPSPASSSIYQSVSLTSDTLWYFGRRSRATTDSDIQGLLEDDLAGYMLRRVERVRRRHVPPRWFQ